MSVFDPYFEKIREFISQMRGNGASVREFQCPAAVSELVDGLPVRVGPHAATGLILRSDTFAELGNPGEGSCSFTLWTNNASLLSDGRITLVGPDIPESGGANLPLGQVLMAGGQGLSKKEYSALEQCQHVSDQIEGYMIKSLPDRLWCRVGKEAARKGFNFEVLGRAVMAICKTALPQIESLEVLFVTTGRQDIERLDEIAAQVRKIGKDIVRETWLERGYDILECTQTWDCATCTDKSVCDEIREVISVRKKKTGDGPENT